MDKHHGVRIQELYADLNKEQLDQAEIHIRRYLSVIIRIAERLQAEGFTAADLDLTRPANGS